MALGLGLQVIGGIAAGAGELSEIDQIQRNYMYNAGVLEKRMEQTLERAADAAARGKREEFAVVRRAKGIKGAQIATGASSGITLNSASLLNILIGTDLMEDVDIQTVKENTRREVKALEEEAEILRGQAIEARRAAGSTSKFASLISTGTSVASKWL